MISALAGAIPGDVSGITEPSTHRPVYALSLLYEKT
jgi:hypothetical protein